MVSASSEDRLLELKRMYVASADEKRAAFAAISDQLVSPTDAESLPPQAVLDELRLLSHRLSGSAGMYEFRALHEAAKSLMLACESESQEVSLGGLQELIKKVDKELGALA